MNRRHGAAVMPRVSVVVAFREPPETLEQTLSSLARQERREELEAIVADGSAAGVGDRLGSEFAWVRHLRLPPGHLPALKASAIAAARGRIVAVLDPRDVAEPGWIDEILAAFTDPAVVGVGGAVVLDGPPTAANLAAYLFEYGAFLPPFDAGPTAGDLPGNNVAYRRRVLVEACAELLATEGFNKPFCHQRLRQLGGVLVLRPSMRVRHLTRYRFWPFGIRRFHYGRCFGAVRWRRSDRRRRLLYAAGAPAVALLLTVRHLVHAARHRGRRRLLVRAAPALVGICVGWGLGEWLGYWLGPGRSCEELI